MKLEKYFIINFLLCFCAYSWSGISKEKVAIILIKQRFWLLKIVDTLALRNKKLRLPEISNNKMVCAVFLLNERILKFRILVEMTAQVQMLETSVWGGQPREGSRAEGALFPFLFIACEMLSTSSNHHRRSQTVWPNSLWKPHHLGF